MPKVINTEQSELRALINELEILEELVPKESGKIEVATSEIAASTEGFPELLAYNNKCNEHAHNIVFYKSREIEQVRMLFSAYLRFLEQGGK